MFLFRTATRNEISAVRTFKRGSSFAAHEVLKFSKASKEWWDPSGQFAMLHRMNPVRVSFIKRAVEQFASHQTDPVYPLTNLKVLDIGCGGGLLSESLKRLGADIMGADASIENIEMAKFHQSLDPSLLNQPGSLSYACTLAEHLVEQKEQFDIVCGLEIVEHVANRDEFIASCSRLVKPNGLLFFSTMNKSLLSKFLTIDVAENLLNIVPRGTHDYSKYVEPEAFRSLLQNNSCKVLDLSGLVYNPLNNSWFLSDCQILVNYILCAQKIDTE